MRLRIYLNTSTDKSTVFKYNMTSTSLYSSREVVVEALRHEINTIYSLFDPMVANEACSCVHAFLVNANGSIFLLLDLVKFATAIDDARDTHGSYLLGERQASFD